MSETECTQSGMWGTLDEVAQGDFLAVEAMRLAHEAHDPAPLSAAVREIVLGGKIGPLESGFLGRLISRALLGARN